MDIFCHLFKDVLHIIKVLVFGDAALESILFALFLFNCSVFASGHLSSLCAFKLMMDVRVDVDKGKSPNLTIDILFKRVKKISELLIARLRPMISQTVHDLQILEAETEAANLTLHLDLFNKRRHLKSVIVHGLLQLHHHVGSPLLLLDLIENGLEEDRRVDLTPCLCESLNSLAFANTWELVTIDKHFFKFLDHVDLELHAI
jgi:hypothetical protein